MARRKKENLNQDRWNVGRYFRLSKEDGDKVESDSIDSQRSLASDWCKQYSNLTIVDDYVDDGWSGTNFNRPSFQRMVNDIKSKKINCVIVKDLSRLGRNYIEAGHYLEMVFPLYDVRFISINDRIDSYLDPYSINNAIVPFKNVMNDEYCRDISNKVRSSLTTRRKRGKFIGSFASYGYKKDPQDHSHLVIDEKAAQNVRLIYQLYISGTSIIGIAKKLNEMGIPNPSAYKRLNGENYQHPHSADNDDLWPDSSVRRILTNQLYVGDLVQGKNKIKSYKISKTVAIPESDWIIVENTHEPIISREDFAQVKDILSRNTRTKPTKTRVYPFSGYLRCADCKRAMNRKILSQPYKEYCYYICSTFKKMNSSACTKHTIRSDKLENAVLAVINTQAQFAIKMNDMLKQLERSRKKSDQLSIVESAIREKQNEKSKNVLCMADLYPDWKNGVISQEEYVVIKTRLTEKNKALDNDLSKLEDDLKNIKSKKIVTNEFIEHFKKYGTLQQITREVVVELIDMIYVHEGGEITIQFKYRDEYQNLINMKKEQQKSCSA